MQVDRIILPNIFSALHFASSGQHARCVDILLQSGAKHHVADTSGKTAWQLAERVDVQETL